MTDPTTPTERNVAAIADRIERMVTARRARDMGTATTLLQGLVRTPDEVFALMLTLARTAAFPAVVARRRMVAAGQGVQGIVPMNNNLSPAEFTALRMVALFANDNAADADAALNLAGETILRNDPVLTQNVLTTLVDILAQGGPRLRPVLSPFGQN